MTSLRSRLGARRRLSGTIRNANVTVGEDFHVGIHSTIWAPRNLTFGKSCFLGSYCRIEVDGTFGDHVLMSNSVAVIGRRDHDMSEIGVPITQTKWVGDSPEHLSDPVRVGSDVWIGYGACVLSGVTIGDSSVVAAGALVVDDVLPNTIVAGVPARPIRKRFSRPDYVEHRKQLRQLGVRLDEDE